MGAMNQVGIGLYWPDNVHRFLGIGSWAPYKFKNTGSDHWIENLFKEVKKEVCQVIRKFV
jgi:hypothetical protein